MSLNFFETLLDKLSPRDNGNSVLKNWTGSQNLMGSNVSFNDSILIKYQEALMEANDNSSTNLSIKRSPLDSIMFPFHHSISSNSLVSRVSRLFFPAALPFLDYNRRNQDNNIYHKMSVNNISYPEVNLWEEFMQEALNLAVNITKHHSSNFEHIQKTKNSVQRSTDTDFSNTISKIPTSSAVNNVPNTVIEGITESSPAQQVENCIEPKVNVGVLESSSKQKSMKLSEPSMVVVTVSGSSTVPKNKKLTVNNGTLNEELANRKTKEIQKRSKNRRRRQKKNNKNVQKNSTNISNDQKSRLPKLCEPDPAVSQIDCGMVSNMQKCASICPPKLCNVINITDNAKSVQIILPNVSSFLITVDSAEEDSDWDENSDCEWLNDTSEFELCGLNVANLPCSKPKSLLSVPPCEAEDAESLQLNMLLHRVNKEWNEATKDLDGKSRSSTKVSFVPDDELVEVLPVEIYERKGEWEMYAIERLRFKRRIDELDRIISPCLNKEHREKIFQKHFTEL